MAYTTMKKLIRNANIKNQTGAWSLEQYEIYRETQQKKLDVFFAAGRITEAEYGELSGMWIEE